MSESDNPLPWYYAVNDRPARVIERTDGRMETQVFEWASGAFVPDRDYFMKVLTPGKDVDQFTAEDFEQRVRALRLVIVERFVNTGLKWEHTGDAEIPYVAKVGSGRWTMRLNDFPAEPLYTLLIDNEEVVDMDDWPAAWVRPEIPQALLDAAAKATKR